MEAVRTKTDVEKPLKITPLLLWFTANEVTVGIDKVGRKRKSSCLIISGYQVLWVAKGPLKCEFGKHFKIYFLLQKLFAC